LPPATLNCLLLIASAKLTDMYVGIDIGGTKTLVAALDSNGVIKERVKFPTPKKYDEFLTELKNTLSQFEHKDFKAGGLAVPGRIDHKKGTVIRLGNVRTWGNDIPLQHDVQNLCKCPIVMRNDAQLGGLSEAMLLKGEYSKVLYVTVSTGIGISLVVDCEIDTNIGEGGGKAILLEHDGKLVPWETFASGHAIVERYGKKAMDITDEKTWKAITRDLSLGLIELIAITQPDVIVIGGSVGTYFDRYGDLLDQSLQRFHLPLATIPPVVGAQRAEEAVVYGCYDLARAVFGKA